MKWRPSNGTEGDSFIAGYCGTCARSEHNAPDAPDDAPVGCPILDLTFLHDVDDPEYPEEWQDDEGKLGPHCTAWVIEGEVAPPLRCTRTADMFAAAAMEAAGGAPPAPAGFIPSECRCTITLVGPGQGTRGPTCPYCRSFGLQRTDET